MIYGFGDSWMYGAELDLKKENPFIHHLSKKVNSEYKNFSDQGMSFGHITQTTLFELKNNNVTKDDFVIIVIPPDIRGYGESDGVFYSIMVMEDTRKDFIKRSQRNTESFGNQGYLVDSIHHWDSIPTRTLWYSYHHSLFIFTLQSILKSIGCKYVMMHNYGKLKITTEFKDHIDISKFLDYKESLTTLLNGVDIDTIANKIDGPSPDIFTGKYFEGMGTHPNELGHKKIADFIYNNKNFKEWLMLTMSGVNSKKL